MRRNRAKSLIEYGIELFGWGLVVASLFRNAAFRSIPSCSLTQSNLVFWAIWLLILGLGFAFTPKRYRNGISIYVTVNSAIGIYIVLSYFNIYRTLITVVLIATGVGLASFVCLFMHTNLKDFCSGKLDGKLGRFFVYFFF